ncbi:hypothetical protein GCM10023189_02230 [Nibrella saemangeumensis]|uniref:Secreted protein n=1 Tax=Nibrella saemangeumensis TaxID=1084526 RepID=A0ABP8MBD8_9BACT
MKTKQWTLALALTIMGSMAQFSCDSKTENKAEEVQDEYKDVQEAKEEGDSSDVREEQSELDTARKEYIKEGTKEQSDSQR